jgi:hypothetical protein
MKNMFHQVLFSFFLLAGSTLIAQESIPPHQTLFEFDAAKMIQQRDFALWKQSHAPQFESTLDLKNEIRPYLDMLSYELLASLARVSSDTQLSSYVPKKPLLNRPSDQIDEDIWQKAISPFFQK